MVCGECGRQGHDVRNCPKLRYGVKKALADTGKGWVAGVATGGASAVYEAGQTLNHGWQAMTAKTQAQERYHLKKFGAGVLGGHVGGN